VSATDLENETLKNELAEMRARLEAIERTGKPTGIGKTPPPSDLKPTGVLEGMKIDLPPAVNAGKTIFRCGIRPEYPFQSADIVVAGVNFSTKTARWEGQGDEAVMHERRGALAALTDADIARVKAELQYTYLRFARHPDDGTITGVERVCVQDGGSVDVEPGTNRHIARPSQPLLGRTQGNEVPLANFLVFEPWGNSQLYARSVPAALAKAQAEAEEQEDIEATAPNILGSMERGHGGKRRSGNAKLLKEMSTEKLGPTPASAGILS
jgi:hypothetical protein